MYNVLSLKTSIGVPMLSFAIGPVNESIAIVKCTAFRMTKGDNILLHNFTFEKDGLL